MSDTLHPQMRENPPLNVDRKTFKKHYSLSKHEYDEFRHFMDGSPSNAQLSDFADYHVGMGHVNMFSRIMLTLNRRKAKARR